MLQWLRLAILMLLCAVVHAKDVECDDVYYYGNCWNSETQKRDSCWICEIGYYPISKPDKVIFISPTHFDGTVADVEFVQFSSADVTQMPKIIHKTNNKQIFQVELYKTNTEVLSSQFFGSSGENVTYFVSYGNNLCVAADAFQNCTNLEHLDLNDNGIVSIPPATFRGLHKLNRLDLGRNELSLVLSDWFYGLGNVVELNLGRNQLEEIPDNCFEALTSLKELYLDGNKIEVITRATFQNPELQKINLRYNKVHRIQAGSFARLSQLTVLDLSENDCVTKIFKTSKEIAEGLSACYLPTESACVFPQISNGIIISIDDNSTQLPGDLFEGSGSVKVVCNKFFTQIHDKANQTTNRCVEAKWEDLQWPTCQSKSLFFISQGC